jgi:hypothetical protein
MGRGDLTKKTRRKLRQNKKKTSLKRRLLVAKAGY